jgi:A/G-specific adenine glycosylase
MEIVYPLGLKWRAKNLQITAADILSKFDGNIPSDKEKLLKIKGVGEYIADSIRYQAFGIRTSIIDSNVVRIIGRLHGLKIDPESRRDKKFRDIANELLPPIAFKKFNLALLDLGALVCTRCPQCKICPLKSHCEYYIKKQGK